MTADKTNLDPNDQAERIVAPADGAKGLPVAGYKRVQPQWALDLVNANKIEEEKALRNIDHHASLGNEVDQRAVALARTKIQEAYMWLNRAVFQPQRLEGDL